MFDHLIPRPMTVETNRNHQLNGGKTLGTIQTVALVKHAIWTKKPGGKIVDASCEMKYGIPHCFERNKV